MALNRRFPHLDRTVLAPDTRLTSTAVLTADTAATEDPVAPSATSWTGANSVIAYRRGLTIALQIPALILACTGAGFGALAHDAGISAGLTAFMSVVLYATPAQVVLVDQIARGASLLGAAFAICLTGIRLLPMMVSLMPYLRSPGAPRWQYVLAAHFIAITGWTEAFRRLPHLPQHLRLPHFLGIGSGLVTALTIGTLTGYWLAGVVPPLLTSALLFMTPLYFTMSLILNAHKAVDWAALASGMIFGPIAFLLAPGFDLLLTGLIGGTFAFLLARRIEENRA